MRRSILLLGLFGCFCAEAQDAFEYKPIPGWNQLSGQDRLEKLRFTTPAYQ